MERRMYAFSKDSIYYVPNSTGESLKAVREDDKEKWLTQKQLEALTSRILRLTEGMDLVIYTSIEEDEYTVRLSKYDTTLTTDDTHISTKGTSHINSVTAEGSESCKMLFSFDNRQHWYTFKDGEFKMIRLSLIHDEGIPLLTVKDITTEQWNQIFKRTFLDYAVAVDAGQSFKGITLSLPGNSPPEINKFEMDIDEVHKNNINLEIEVEDLEEDDMTYELYINDNEEPLISKALNPLAHGMIEITVPNEELEVGKNAIKFVIKDEKDAETVHEVNILKSNNMPEAHLMLNNDILNIVISDLDEGDKVRYSILLNDEELVPMTDFKELPLKVKYALPRDKILFGEDNEITVVFGDDVKQYKTVSETMTFSGSYYGLLFADSLEDDGKGSSFYSNSVGEILKALVFDNLYRNGQTQAEQIYIINRSSEKVEDIKIYPENLSNDVNLEISLNRTPFIPVNVISFSNIEYGGSRSFFVRLKSTNDYTGKFSGRIFADAYENEEEQ